MPQKSTSLFLIFSVAAIYSAVGQHITTQQGMVLKAGTAIRLADVKIINKHTQKVIKSSFGGTFTIAASSGDTLELSSAGYQYTTFVVTDFIDQVLYLQPATELQEVVVKASSVAQDLANTQLGYRKQGVFYTGNPHYYYLFLKPFTFIYENFKSEVKNARRFKKYASNELKSLEVAQRFNDTFIKQVIPITADELDEFKSRYEPTVEQIRKWSDYDLIVYIRNSYKELKSYAAK